MGVSRTLGNDCLPQFFFWIFKINCNKTFRIKFHRFDVDRRNAAIHFFRVNLLPAINCSFRKKPNAFSFNSRRYCWRKLNFSLNHGIAALFFQIPKKLYNNWELWKKSFSLWQGKLTDLSTSWTLWLSKLTPCAHRVKNFLSNSRI